LLDTVSLFPIHSFIASNDGCAGRLLRPNPGRYDRSVVEVWRQRNLGERPTVLDLAGRQMRQLPVRWQVWGADSFLLSLRIGVPLPR
jgi:hypothetical protein